jgi:Ser/Thr protein kinase RdoA (MazF antagonist)
MVLASGIRIQWPELPQTVRNAVERILGAPVAEVAPQTGGFSPGTADRVVTTEGRRAFVKAVSSAQNPVSPQMHRTEARNVALLPAGLPVPKLLGTHDDGDWIALVLEDVDGRHPHTPWRPAEIDAALAALKRLAVPIPGVALPALRDDLATEFAQWAQIPVDPDRTLGRRDHARLAALAESGVAALDGDCLVHGDIRADNLLVRPDGTIVVVDWSDACTGPAWFDTLTLVLNIRLYGGRVPDTVIDADDEAITGCIAGLASLFASRAIKPPPPGLPTVRAFQQAQVDVCLAWLDERGY